MAGKKQNNKGNNFTLNAVFKELVQKADVSLNDEEKKVAETLANFIKGVRTQDNKKKQYPTPESQKRDPLYGIDAESFSKKSVLQRLF